VVVITKKNRIEVVHSVSIIFPVGAIGVEDGEMEQGRGQFSEWFCIGLCIDFDVT
jgi:hypothetical protein